MKNDPSDPRKHHTQQVPWTFAGGSDGYLKPRSITSVLQVKKDQNCKSGVLCSPKSAKSQSMEKDPSVDESLKPQA